MGTILAPARMVLLGGLSEPCNTQEGPGPVPDRLAAPLLSPQLLQAVLSSWSPFCSASHQCSNLFLLHLNRSSRKLCFGVQRSREFLCHLGVLNTDAPSGPWAWRVHQGRTGWAALTDTTSSPNAQADPISGTD